MAIQGKLSNSNLTTRRGERGSKNKERKHKGKHLVVIPGKNIEKEEEKGTAKTRRETHDKASKIILTARRED